MSDNSESEVYASPMDEENMPLAQLRKSVSNHSAKKAAKRSAKKAAKRSAKR